MSKHKYDEKDGKRKEKAKIKYGFLQITLYFLPFTLYPYNPPYCPSASPEGIIGSWTWLCIVKKGMGK
jgi:hypothetical protein